MYLPLSRVLVLFSCISVAFAQSSDNSTNTNDTDDGNFGTTAFVIVLFFFMGLFVPLTFIMGTMFLIVRLPGDVAAYCCGYRILPEEQRVGEPVVFRDNLTGHENAVRYGMVRYRTPNMSEEEESYTHYFYRQNPVNNNEQQQDQQHVLLVPTCCPRYAVISDQWSWPRLVLFPMIMLVMTIRLIVNCSVLVILPLRHFGASTAMAYALFLFVYGGTALWAFRRQAIRFYGQEGWWNPCYSCRLQQTRPGSSEPIYSRVTDHPDSMNEGDEKTTSATTECLDDQIALMETVV
jgi:hypothetical protein